MVKYRAVLDFGRGICYCTGVHFKKGACKMDLTGKKVLMVIAANNFRDEEYAEPRKVLETAGARVTVACSTLNTAKGKLGLEVKPDVLISGVKEADYDGIVFVGGGGSQEYFESPVAHELAKNFHSRGKLTSAICIAPAILANAGLLNKKKATSFPSSREALQAKGAVFTGAGVESDGLIVTGSGPEAATQFGQKLVEVLRGK
jgi:protease I